MAKKVEDDFNFDDYYEDTEEQVEEDNHEEIEGVFSDEEEYDRMLDLHGNIRDIGVDAEYPYLMIEGFLIIDEVRFMADRINKYKSRLPNVCKSELLPVIFNINNTKRKIDELPLTLDTLLTIISVHKYDVYLVQAKDNKMKITGNMMKALIFT